MLIARAWERQVFQGIGYFSGDFSRVITFRQRKYATAKLLSIQAISFRHILSIVVARSEIKPVKSKVEFFRRELAQL